MKIFRTILLSLAALAAGTPATRADEMSDLVAAVAASMETQQRMQADALTPTLNNGRRYTPSAQLTTFYLDGILRAMEVTGNYEPSIPKKGEHGLSDSPFKGMGDPMTGSLLQPFYRPVPGPITSRFGWRPAFQRVHHGVDLALQIGDTVRAAVSGRVTLISYDHTGYGHYVVLSHPDGMETLYGHLQYPLVVQGQFIYSGQPIGIGGNTGNSTGPHLHFEARLEGVAVDPLIMFDFYGVGQYLYAEETAAEASPKTPAYSHQQKSLKQEATYIVRFGDTPESVARQAGISVMRLCQLNMLNSSEPLPVGRMLKLR